MNFLKRLLGRQGESAATAAGDADGFFVYVKCDRCDEVVRLRISKQHDLNRDNGGFVWHKTVVDSRCFRPIPTVAHFDRHFQLAEHEIEGGRFVAEAEYQAGRQESPG